MATTRTTKLHLGGGTVWLLPLNEIPGAELFDRAKLTSDETNIYASFLPSQAQRRKEWLAARVLAYEKLGGRIGYEPSGRPLLLSSSGLPSDRHISISHTSGWAALMVADRPCGIDIEPAGRSAQRVAGRIASAEEIALATPLFPQNPALLVWCAKEAAYKAIGSTGTDFREHIHVRNATARTLIIAVKAESITLEIFTQGALLGVCGSLY